MHNQILQEIKFISKELALSNSDMLPSYSIGQLGGSTLFYLYSGRLFSNAGDFNRGIDLLEKLIVNSARLNQGNISSGLGGVCWLLDICRKESFIEQDVNEIFPKIDLTLSNWISETIKLGNLDYLHGAIGTFIYLLHRYKDNNIEAAVIEKLMDELLTTFIRIEDGGYFPFYSNLEQKIIPEICNLGLSHGIMSIIYAIAFAGQLGVRKTQATIVLKEVFKLIDVIISNNINEKNYQFPFSYDLKTKRPNSGGRIAWCYGDFGNSISILKAGEFLGQPALRTFAQDLCSKSLASTIEEQGIVDSGLCHGLTGAISILDFWYRKTDKSLFLEYKNSYMNRYLQGFPNQNFHRNSFDPKTGYAPNYTMLEGISGIGLSLLSELDTNKHYWKQLFLLDYEN
jgi:lantibiotic modifying enzyme